MMADCSFNQHSSSPINKKIRYGFVKKHIIQMNENHMLLKMTRKVKTSSSLQLTVDPTSIEVVYTAG